jgi:hypothetical protein
MADQEYGPREALELLMRKLNQRDTELATRVQAVVDAGKDVEETEPSTGRRKKNARVYRKSVPYTYGEALQVAINALTAYFVEQPLLVESCLDNMAHAVLGAKHQRYYWSADKTQPLGIVPNTGNREKVVQIELRTETQISRPDQETQELARVPAKQIQEEQANLTKLREIVELTGR